jgi:hypothetical protein
MGPEPTLNFKKTEQDQTYERTRTETKMKRTDLPNCPVTY